MEKITLDVNKQTEKPYVQEDCSKTTDNGDGLCWLNEESKYSRCANSASATRIVKTELNTLRVKRCWKEQTRSLSLLVWRCYRMLIATSRNKARKGREWGRVCFPQQSLSTVWLCSAARYRSDMFGNGKICRTSLLDICCEEKILSRHVVPWGGCSISHLIDFRTIKLILMHRIGALRFWM